MASPMTSLVGALVITGGLLSSWPAWSAEGPLKGLPSLPGPHLGKIERLGDNEWLELGSPTPDPTWGRARGRSWTAAMPLAPELGGAFLYGEGVHGYAKPDGRYMDDLWFYDVNAHRWVCCYPGADTKALQLTLDRDGFEATRDGERLPVAAQAHGYSMSTYDTHGKRFLAMPNLHDYWARALPQRKAWLRPAPADASPWFFATTTGKWNRLRTATTGPRSSYGDTLIYLPSQKRAFFVHRSQEVWFYDTEKHVWEPVKPEGPPPPFGIDATSCYDSRRERIYLGGGAYPVAPDSGHAFWAYDVKTNRWVDPKPRGKPCKGLNNYGTLNALMAYDPLSDRVLLIYHSYHYSTEDRLGVYVYDPRANAWDEQPLELPRGLRNRKVKNGFLDPARNAIFLHSAGDSQDDGVIWVYRYRKSRSSR